VTDRSGPQLLAGVVLTAGLFVAAVLPVPYVVLSPGPVYDTLGTLGDTPLIKVTGAPTYPTTGRLDLTTVSEIGAPGSRLSVVDVLRGWIDRGEAVVPREILYPPEVTEQDIEQENAAAMADSQDAATVAALRWLKLPVTLTVAVQAVSADGPSKGLLEHGDRIESVDGVAVSTPEQVRDRIGPRAPGTPVTLRIVRDGVGRDVTITTRAHPDVPGRAYIGISPSVGYTSPVTVTIKLDDVGGPSAGLMFSLGIVDRLTPEQETAGAHVAGTGTIDADGRVGPIGGVEQKLFGAQEAGATVFLVPADNCADAVAAGVEGVRLVKVDSLAGALAALTALRTGSGTVPGC